MNKLNPYLMFAGTCEDAMNFYKTSLSGEIISLQRYEESPMEVTEAIKTKVMHLEFTFEGNTIMGADAPPETFLVSGNNVTLSIGLNDVQKAERYFTNLADGGQVLMPLQDTFWGAKFGMLTDKFGVNWMVNCETAQS